MLSYINESIKEYYPCKHAISWVKGAVGTAKDPLNSLIYKVSVAMLKVLTAIACLVVELALFTPVKSVHFTVSGIYNFCSGKPKSNSGSRNDDLDDDQIDLTSNNTVDTSSVDDSSNQGALVEQVEKRSDSIPQVNVNPTQERALQKSTEGTVHRQERQDTTDGSKRTNSTQVKSNNTKAPTITQTKSSLNPGQSAPGSSTPGQSTKASFSEVVTQASINGPTQSKNTNSTTNNNSVLYREVAQLQSAPISSSSSSSSSSGSLAKKGLNTKAATIARNIDKVANSANKVIIPMLSFGKGMATHISAPWGFLPVKTAECADMFYIDIDNPIEDGSLNAGFKVDPKLQAFEREYRVTFPLHMSAEAPITFSPQVCQKLGIPANAKAFHFIYPGALSMKFDNKAEDTPQRRAEIMKAMSLPGKLSEEMQFLLQVGGYFYHAEESWRETGPRDTRTGKREKTRYIAGINALKPGGSLSTTQLNQFYFGQAKIVPESIVAELADCAQLTDNYYDDLASGIEDSNYYPAMCPITVGDLKTKMKLSHFKWLEPGHPMIKKYCDEMKEPTFGKDGVFAYYSKTDPALSCMLPVVDDKTWKKILRNTTFVQVDKDNEAGEIVAFTEDHCVLCLTENVDNINDNGTLEKIVRFSPCNHMNVCEPCYLSLLQKSVNPYTNAPFTPLCPTCRTGVTEVDYPAETQAMAFKSHTELGQFTLGYAKLSANYIKTAQNGDLAGMLIPEKFSDPITEVSPTLRKELKIPADITHCSFLYPLYGRGYDSTCSYLSAVKAEVDPIDPNDSTNVRVLSKDQQLFKGVVSNGGYVFYDKNKNAQFVYSILPEDSGIEPEFTLNYKTESLSSVEADQLAAEVAKSKNPDIDKYNVSRTTLKSILAFARRFSRQADDYFYETSSKKDTFWKAKLITSKS